MATDIKYNLAWLPGVANSEFVADYSLNFSTFSATTLYLQGSYNTFQIDAKTIYINNKQNNNIVTLSANLSNGNSPYVRQVPPFGEAYLPIATYQSITLAANAGVTSIEISNTARDETIFQRTDTSSQIINLSAPTTAVNGDLVTINRMGILNPCIAATVAGNNSATDYPADTAWPGLIDDAWADSFRSTVIPQDSGGYTVHVGVSAGAGLMRLQQTNFAGANFLRNLATPWVAQQTPSVGETLNNYVAKFNNEGIVYIGPKNSNVLMPASIVGITFGGVTCNNIAAVICHDLTTNNFLIIGRNDVDNTDLRIYTVVAGAITAVSAKIPITAGAWAAGGTVRFTKLSGGKIVATSFDYNTTAWAYVTFDSVTLAVVSNASGAGNTGIGYQRALTMQPYKVGSGATAFFAYNSTAGNILHIVYCAADGTVIDTNMGFGSFNYGGGVTADGNYYIYVVKQGDAAHVFCYKFAAAGGAQLGVIQVTTLAAAAAPNEIVTYGDYLLWIDGVGNSILILGTPFTYVSTALTTAVIITAFYVPTPLGWAAFTPGTGVSATYKFQFAQSIFGVYRGDGNVQLTGDMNINQNYPGATAFNQNAATVVGNRGLILNNVASLKGLQP